MIVVTTPTGQIGRQVVDDLLAADAAVGLVVRDASRLSVGVRERAQIVEGSHGDPDVIDRALKGADALFWVAPPDTSGTLEETYLDFTRPAATAIRRHGVARVVGVTALGRGTAWEGRAGLVTASIAMDDLLMGSGAAYRGLAMPSFMDNLLRQASGIRDTGLLFGPLDPDLKAPVTATRDMGAVAASLLADPEWSGQQEVPVLGPEDLSFNEMAAIVSDVIGREVRYKQISFDAFHAGLLGNGVSPSFAQGYVDMMRAKNEGMDNLAQPPARTPTSFRAWCEAALRPAILHFSQESTS